MRCPHLGLVDGCSEERYPVVEERVMENAESHEDQLGVNEEVATA
jgi:hypothetical protein